MGSPFDGARLKIDRAKENIHELQMRAQIFGDENPHSIAVETDSNTGINVLSIAPAKPFPPILLAILGDALHNLRVAIDHAWYASCIKCTDFTKFPVRETRESFEAAINGLKENARKEVKDFLRDSVQPYTGGKGEIFLHLHNLDIEDKHRLLIAHRQYTFIDGIIAVDDRGETFEVPRWLVVPPHTASQPFEGHEHFKITDNGKALTLATFGEGMPLQGKRVMPTLHHLVELVSRTVDIFEKIYFLPKD